MDRETKYLKRRNGKQKAQGLVEFSLILPVLLLLLFGIVDFGWMVFNYSQLYNATREAARFGSVSGFGASAGYAQYKDCDGIKTVIKKLAGFSGVKDTNITIAYDDGIPFDVDAWVASSTHFPSITAYCDGTTFTIASWHVGTETPTATGARTSSPYPALNNGDRIVIQVDVNVQFLTPIIRSFAKTGMNMKFWVGRSVFPSGEAAGS